MADRKITLKRNNSGTTEVLYPTTTVDQLFTSNGQTAVFDTANKLKYAYLPEGIVGGLKFQGAVAVADVDDEGLIASLLDDMVITYTATGAVGSYWIASEPLVWLNSTGVSQLGNPLRYYEWIFQEFSEEGQDGTATGISFEAGDWIVIVSIAGSGTQANPYSMVLSQINNTYGNATNSQRGIVELATNAETSTGTDNTRAVTPAGLASVLTSYVTTDNDTTYTVGLSGADDNISLDLNAGGSGSGTDSITFTAGTRIALNLLGDNMEVSFTGTIPTITLNNTGTTTPSFYAPTESGTAGSGTVSRQGLFSAGAGAEPTWVDAPKVFYDDITGWLHGDIVIDLDV
jgi:hypothetical protein